MTSIDTEPTIDVNIPRFSQALVATLTGVAFVTQQAWLVAATFVVLALSWLGGRPTSLFTQIYVRLVRPRVDPNGPSEVEPAAPPRFAQLIGTVFLGAAWLSLALGLDAVGWGLALVVTALAALAAATRICVGCLVYERTFAR